MRTLVPVGADLLDVEDSLGDGPPLVLLHPGAGDLRVWDPVWDDLAGPFRAVRYSVRGYGDSPAPTERYDWVGDLRAFVEHLGLGAVHLVGNSNGGATAIEYALRYPDAVRSLVLLAPGLGGWTPEVTPEVEQRVFQASSVADVDPEPLVDVMLEIWAQAGHEPFVRDLMRSGVRGHLAQQKYLEPLPPALDRVAALTVPTVLMVGDRDLGSLQAMNLDLADRIPGCRTVRMAGVDHLPSVRVPALVAEVVRDHCGQA